MKVGDYVTVQEIMNQSECRWVVLANLKFTERNGVKGGTVGYIGNTKTEAGDAQYELEHDGSDTYLVCGACEELVVGGVFVE
jgi:hypothetical protein